MTQFFRHKIVLYFFSAALFLGFGFKTGIACVDKWSLTCIEMEDEFPADEDKNTKDDKSGRSLKKMCCFDVPNLHQFSHKDPTALEAHNRVYLLAIFSEPLIPIPIEPPELA